MFQVTINGKIENYEAGTPYLTIAKKHQAEYPQDIILVFVNGKLTELYKSLKKDCELKFVTTADAPGMQTYQRSATLMMLKWWVPSTSRGYLWISRWERAFLRMQEVISL